MKSSKGKHRPHSSTQSNLGPESHPNVSYSIDRLNYQTAPKANLPQHPIEIHRGERAKTKGLSSHRN